MINNKGENMSDMVSKAIIAKKTKNIVNTGYKLIKILKLLLENPKSYEEINKNFLKDESISKPTSDDMICIYINTLRQLGCRISRPSKSNNFKYVLLNHPFKINISEKDSFILSQIIENIFIENNWKMAWDVIELFKELQSLCTEYSDTSFLNNLHYHFKIKNELMHKLAYYCENSKLISLKYNSPKSGTKNVKIIAEKITLENNHFYIWGYNTEQKTNIYIRIDRIVDVNIISINQCSIPKKPLFKAKYKLFGNAKINFQETPSAKIISQTSNYIEIEEEVSNKFYFIQKILQHAEECVVSEPLSIKEEIIKIIEEVLAIYE